MLFLRSLLIQKGTIIQCSETPEEDFSTRVSKVEKIHEPQMARQKNNMPIFNIYRDEEGQ